MQVQRRTVIAGVSMFCATAGWAGGRGPGIYAADGIALGGTDPVGYFIENRPKRGSPRFALKWKSAIWHFDNVENLSRFEMDPVSNSPAYGGYCAMSMAARRITPSVPEAFVVVGGRLFLCSSLWALAQFQRDLPNNIGFADAHWVRLTG